MPESFPSLQEARCSALEEFFRSPDGAPAKTRCQSTRMTPHIRINCGNPGGDKDLGEVVQPSLTSDCNGRNRQRARANPRQSIPVNVDEEPETPPRTQLGSGRKPGTSQYYGVRFRPDLNKWVAEIRVAEWKAVDKKVWLGTFDTEQAAARGVDLARKLLKCTKKHSPNLPCAKLDAYSKQIPPNLILTDLTATSMFKSTTLFIKSECKQYAASFNDDTPTPAASAPQLGSSSGGQFFNQTSSSSHDLEYYENTSGTENSDDLDDLDNDLDDLDDDLDDSEESDDFSDMILEYYAGGTDLMTINDHHMSTGLEVDTYSMPVTNYNYELMSSPSSCNSTASCMTTLEAMQLQGQDNNNNNNMVPAAAEWKNMIDYSGCKDGSMMMFQSTAPSSEILEGMSMMESAMLDVDVGAVSQQWADDASLFHIWPGLQYPSCSSASLTQLPDNSLCELTSYMSSMHGGYVAPAMDSDPWSLQGAHYPFLQHGPSGWR